MIIDRTEKNRILKLYGLINENNIIYEETVTLTKDTEFGVSGSGTNWVITLLSSDKEKQVSKIDTGSTGRECEARGCVRRRRRREGRAPARELQVEGQGC